MNQKSTSLVLKQDLILITNKPADALAPIGARPSAVTMLITITCTNAELSSMNSVAFTWDQFPRKDCLCEWVMSVKITPLKLLPHLPGGNELTIEKIIETEILWDIPVI